MSKRPIHQQRKAGIRSKLTDRKLKIVRAAAQHQYPTADIDRMLAEIEAGYKRN